MLRPPSRKLQRDRPASTRAGATLILLLLQASTVAVAAGDGAGGGLELVASDRSRIQLEGSTNVHRWSCEGESVEARMSVDAPMARVEALLATVEAAVVSGAIPENLELPEVPPPSFRLVVPVHSLDCGNPRMERDLEEALAADRHPLIEYRFQVLERAILEPAMEGVPRRYRLEVLGTLKLAGVSREIRSTAFAEPLEEAAFRIEGTLELKMTDFDVTPPTALLGIIRARDALSVHFDLHLESVAEPERPGLPEDRQRRTIPR